MKLRMITRNIVIGTQRTTIRLEAAVWEALDDICVRERMTRHEFCSRVEALRNGGNRAQGIRTVVVNYCLLFLKKHVPDQGIFDEALQYKNDLVA